MSAPLILTYLNKMYEHNASDMYLTVGLPPTLRGDNTFMKLSEADLTLDAINEILSSILTSRQRRDFDMHMELNTAIEMGEHGRFRVNILRQRQFPALVIRRIISKIPSFKDLGLPEILGDIAMEKRGLVLVTGMTGSGKSTTLAAMVDKRNNDSSGHIITIEDPIEFFHDHKGCVITQREVGVDTDSFAMAMKNALRQRPDVVLLGEIRDREVMEQALTMAETGHLCLATIHSNNSYQAIERIVNLFPDDAHNQIRLNLSMNLKSIVSQRLLPTLDGGLAPAIEVLINQGFIRDLIMSGEIGKIRDVMEQNNAIGMSTFDQSLMKMFLDDVISEDTAVSNSDKPSDIKIKLQQANLTKSSKGKQAAFGSVDTSKMMFSE